jgi:hypothetical protein
MRCELQGRGILRGATDIAGNATVGRMDLRARPVAGSGKRDEPQDRKRDATSPWRPIVEQAVEARRKREDGTGCPHMAWRTRTLDCSQTSGEWTHRSADGGEAIGPGESRERKEQGSSERAKCSGWRASALKVQPRPRGWRRRFVRRASEAEGHEGPRRQRRKTRVVAGKATRPDPAAVSRGTIHRVSAQP